MKTTNPGNDSRKTLFDAMTEIENGQKWWTVKEISCLLKELGWLGSGSDKIRKADIHSLIALAITNERFECRFNQAMQENEFRLCDMFRLQRQEEEKESDVE